MRYTGPAISGSLALLAATAITGGAAADTLATATANVLNAKPIAFEGYKYGGNIPVGAEANPAAMHLLIKSADAMGQLRDNRDITFLLLGDTTLAMRIDADGTWNGQKSHVILDWDYGVPGVRLDVRSADGKSRQVTVVANNLAWDEKTPGIYGGAASNSANERLILGYLMPSEVILEERDGVVGTKVSKDTTGHDVLTIPIAKLGAGVNNVVTLDTDGHPVHSQIAYNGHTYSADFTDFLGDRMDMMVVFSHHVVVQTDGKTTADLQLNWHQANPYLIFPVPSEVASK